MTDSWYVYILLCADGTLYTGVTTDVAKRILVHNEGKTGAKYTKARRPVRLVYQEAHLGRGTALKREAAIKKLTRGEKQTLIKGLDK